MEQIIDDIKKKRSTRNELETRLADKKEQLSQKKKLLLLHYHKLLLEGRDTRNDGLSWIVKAIWNLGKNVIPAFLPRFFDPELIKFLFAYTKDLLKYEEIKKEIERFQYENQRKKAKSLQVIKSKLTEIEGFKVNAFFTTDLATKQEQKTKQEVTRKDVFD